MSNLSKRVLVTGGAGFVGIVNRDGSQTRAFCVVDDTVDGLLRMMASGDDLPGPVNIGNLAKFTIRASAEQVNELTGARSTLVMKPLPSDDPKRRQQGVVT